MARRVADLDPRDYHARIAIRAQLREARELEQLTQRQVAQAMGTEAANVRRLERQGVDQSYAATVMRWASAVNRRLVVEPVGFPTPARTYGGMNTVLATVTLPGPYWQVMRTWHTLAGIRAACGISQPQLADVLGLSPQAVSLFENAESSSLLVVLQRHARAIARCCPPRAGGYLDVRVVPVRDTESSISA